MNKKCVCGYEVDFDYVVENGRTKIKKVKGEEEFIKVNIVATIRKDYEEKQIEVYCCPKCKTLKLDI